MGNMEDTPKDKLFIDVFSFFSVVERRGKNKPNVNFQIDNCSQVFCSTIVDVIPRDEHRTTNKYMLISVKTAGRW
jgi:hypothetical protein